MASSQRKAGSRGRVTPKGGAPRPTTGKPARAGAGTGTGTGGTKRRSSLDPETPVTIGRRPSSAGFLAVVAVMWMAVGVILFLTLSTGWRLIPAILAFGIGVLFLRGAASTVIRRERRRSEN